MRSFLDSTDAFEVDVDDICPEEEEPRYKVKKIDHVKVSPPKRIEAQVIIDDGLRDVYNQHPYISKWANDRKRWLTSQGGVGNTRFYEIPKPILQPGKFLPLKEIKPPMIVDDGERNAAGIHPTLVKWRASKTAWETKHAPRLSTQAEPRVMTIEEIYPPTNEEIVGAVLSNNHNNNNTPSLVQDIFEEYLTTHDVTTYLAKTLQTPLKYIFLYMRGELVRGDMGNFLSAYNSYCEPWLLVPPPPTADNFLEEIAFITKYVIYAIDSQVNGIKRDFRHGLFGTTPKVAMFDKVGSWITPYSFVSAKGTFGFSPDTNKIIFGRINTFIA